eukprot:603966-Prymnesium_polylepis.2
MKSTTSGNEMRPSESTSKRLKAARSWSSETPKPMRDAMDANSSVLLDTSGVAECARWRCTQISARSLSSDDEWAALEPSSSDWPPPISHRLIATGTCHGPSMDPYRFTQGRGPWNFAEI